MIYLDSAATTIQKPPSVGCAVLRTMRYASSPGRGGHAFAMRAAETVYAARETAAKLFNVDDPAKVVFTFNATHGLNIAINSLVRDGDTALISGWEHNSVLRPLVANRARLIIAEAGMDREKTLEAFDTALNEKPKLCAINHVSNVTGFVLPVYEIAEKCKRAGVPLIIDASQSAGAFKLDFTKLDADFIAMPGHKGLYGPQGTGLLLVKNGAEPLLFGGSGSSSALPDMPEELPDRLEAGTHNTAGIAGLAKGMAFVMREGEDNILRRERELAYRAAAGLSRIRGVRVFAPEQKNGSGVISFGIEGLSPEGAGQRFSDMGIALRAGLHCSPLAHKTLGTFPEGTVRLSVSAFTNAREIDAFLNAAEDIARTTGRK